MDEFLMYWSYPAIFAVIILTGLGLPVPEELPIVIGGGLVGGEKATFLMLPVCIVAVVIGDSFLFFIGRVWGDRLVERPSSRNICSPQAGSKAFARTSRITASESSSPLDSRPASARRSS